MKKKLLSLALACGMVFSLAACGTPANNDSPAPNTESPAIGTETPAADTPTYEPATVRVAYMPNLGSASSLFTALSDGAVSAAISFARTFLFLVSMLLILPQWLGAWGIWLAVPAAEALGLVVSAVFILWGRRKYGYAPCRGV